MQFQKTYNQTIKKGSKQGQKLALWGSMQQKNQDFQSHFPQKKTGKISRAIGAYCIALCTQAHAVDIEEEYANAAKTNKQDALAQLPAQASSFNVSKGILLAAGTDEQNGVSTQPENNPNALPGESSAMKLQEIQVRAKRLYEVGPLPGLGLTKEEIPGNVQSISAKEIKEANALSITDLMNTKLQSVNVNDYQSNPFQMDVTYRGFTASPQIGTAQGLSVFVDGVRVNEPFGDVVNWDMIPLNALSSIDVFPGGNPVFGLGTLGGAISMRTKSGFTDVGGSTQILTGSFGRKQLQASWGGNNGVIAGFLSANLFMEDGWRDNSPSRVNQVFGKAEWQNENLRLSFATLLAQNKLVGNGMLPTEMAMQDNSQVFTSPDITRNTLAQFQLSGIWDVSDTFNVTAQVYRRDSKRHGSTGDVNTNISGTVTRRAEAGEKVSAGFTDYDRDGLPDLQATVYNVAATTEGYLLDIHGNPQFLSDGSENTAFDPNNLAIGTDANSPAVAGQGTVDVIDSEGNVVRQALQWGANPNSTLNPTLPSQYNQYIKEMWANRSFPNNWDGISQKYGFTSVINNQGGQAYTYSVGGVSEGYLNGNYLDNSGFIVYVGANAINPDDYLIYERDQDGNIIASAPKLGQFNSANPGLGKPLGLIVRNDTSVGSRGINRDGADANSGTGRGTGPGYACDAQGNNCTPTAVITNTQIDQITDGASLQLNWNLEKHKFMVGASIDSAGADYNSKQQLGLLDANRNAYLAADRIGYEYAAASYGLGLNDFNGTSITKSLYASETWSPTKNLNFNTSLRYNATRVRNVLATNNILGLNGPASFLNFYSLGVLCTDNNNDGTITADECPSGEINYFTPEYAAGRGLIGSAETEKFSYYSLNPSFGGTWQVNEKLNVYGNWSQGARTPSVIELGCAYDDTPVPNYDTAGNVISTMPRSLVERRFCSLPSTLSGDPYLKQVISKTLEFGARGYITEDIQWNASVYQSNLEDDIYFVSFTPDRSYFQNVGATRRQGVEMGLQGKSGRASFRVNYSLTDATFQDDFLTASPNNSSAGNVIQRDGLASSLTPTGYQQIHVRPGDRIPGVPLHNLNASFSYDITDNWSMGITAVMHSEAFVRGNENNKHREGESLPLVGGCGDRAVNDYGVLYGSNATCSYTINRPNVRFPGKTPGYAVFNFHTSYKLDKNLTLRLQVNNLFDREYYSAGRLGLNPFSPSTNGLIGTGGFNYNSSEWRSSTFLAPGAPRAAWVSLTYDF
ncbi:TonB-dependent receptor domain-containing protein [Methylovorus sp. MP688]|uniref:TonB-dependent receptor domain-containing protein n=1 Tax=Methylovorus sp. (strain MP688) TaxID=887061 RepID=UPI0001EC454E|nr:TonB-dependent receptor [Methylovorus sp. MP688]ADQ84059.1 TonB-dependent receptor [Methylovorus sp. MP688]